jgi:hypothetical protein
MSRDYEERRAANDESLNEAENHRAIWSVEEDALLLETMDEPIADVAYVLGRSIFAVDMRRSIVRNRGLDARASFDRTRPETELVTYGTRCQRCSLIHRGEC